MRGEVMYLLLMVFGLWDNTDICILEAEHIECFKTIVKVVINESFAITTYLEVP